MEGQVHFMGGKDFLVLELLALHQLLPVRCYRGTSLITNYPLLPTVGLYLRSCGGPKGGGGLFLMSEVPL